MGMSTTPMRRTSGDPTRAANPGGHAGTRRYPRPVVAPDPRRELPFVVPWLLGAATPAERERTLAVAPWPLKAVWYTARRRHDRLTTRALGRARPRQAPRAMQEVA
jgi:hypothetical protein